MKQTQYQHVVFYDGVCLLCNRFIQFALRADRNQKIFISPLQSDFAKETLKSYEIDASKLESVVYFRKGQVFTESSASLNIYRDLGFPWSLMYVFIILPGFIRNAVYRWIARNRYRWFGRAEEVCMIPDASVKNQIIGMESVG